MKILSDNSVTSVWRVGEPLIEEERCSKTDWVKVRHRASILSHGEKNHGLVEQWSLMVQKNPNSKFVQGQKYHIMRVVNLGKTLYSHLLHSNQVNLMGTGLGNKLVV